MKKRVADIIMDTLADCGVEQAFCVVGGGAMYLDNALGISKRIKTVFNHHEQACAMAAEGYARYHSGAKPALVCVTSGPGGTNALTGVMGAYQDSIPMIVVSGQVRFETSIAACPELKLRRRGEQEFDIVHSVANMTKYVKMVVDPKSVRREVRKAYDIAMSGRRGPVWLDIPMNVQRAEIEDDDLEPADPPPEMLKCGEAELDELDALLSQAKSPCLLAGSAIASSALRGQFEEVLRRYEVPVVSAAVVSNALYHDHPLYFGSTGGVGTRCGNFIVQSADVIVVLGCSLGFKQTGFNQECFAPNAKIVMVDVNADEARKPGLRIAKFIGCDLEWLFAELLRRGNCVQAPKAWLEHCRWLKGRFDLFEGAMGKDGEAVNSFNVWRAWEQRQGEDAVTVMGNSSCVTPGLSMECFGRNQVIFTNINCGSMGYGLPAALGAAVAARRDVVLVEGDGSFMMNLQELQTVVHNRLPVKILLFANNGYAGIVGTCKAYFSGQSVGCTPASGLSMPDFSKVSAAFGIPHRVCETNGGISEGLEWLLAQESCAILELRQILPNPVAPLVKARLNADGTSSAPKPYDMYPFMDPEDVKRCIYHPDGAQS